MFTHGQEGKDILASIVVSVNSLNELEKLGSDIAVKYSIKTAIYYDEYERLVRKYKNIGSHP
jgi:hypothetical protein